MEKTKTFFCDICGEEKIGKKHKLYDENWNFDGAYQCNDCYEIEMESKLNDIKNEKI